MLRNECCVGYWKAGPEKETKPMTTRTARINLRISAAIAALFMLTLPLAGLTITDEWMPEWRGDENYNDGYFHYPVAITCSERDDEWRRLNNGCTVKISKTDTKGFTKFTATYLDEGGRKQTVSHSWRDDEGGVDFEYKGRRYWFNWDAVPYGCWLEVDVVYDVNGEWMSSKSSHFYLIEPKGNGGVAIPAEWQKARTLNGLYGEGCGGGAGGVEGTAQLKCGKANKKGIAKVSLTVTPFSGKMRKYASVSVDVSQGGDIEVKWLKQSYSVTIREGGDFFGEPIYGDMRPACSPNAVWSANVGGNMSGLYTIIFPYWDEVWYDDNGYIHRSEGSYAAFMEVAAAKFWHQYEEGGYCPNGGSIFFNGGHFTASGKKWNFRSTDGNDKSPRITYNPKTGLFTGSIYLTVGPYCMYPEGMMPRSKKVTLKAKGVYVDGMIFGAATYRSFTTPIVGE